MLDKIRFAVLSAMIAGAGIAHPVYDCTFRQVMGAGEIGFQFSPDDHVIDSRYWNALDAIGRAGLILHEILYRDLLGSSSRNSAGVRYFNAVLSSSRMDTLSEVEYRRALRAAFLDGVVYFDWMNAFAYVYLPDVRIAAAEAETECRTFHAEARLMLPAELAMSQVGASPLGRALRNGGGSAIWVRDPASGRVTIHLPAPVPRVPQRLPVTCAVPIRP